MNVSLLMLIYVCFKMKNGHFKTSVQDKYEQTTTVSTSWV